MKILLNHRRLARILAARNLSQNRWAQRLGLDRGHLSQLVNGRRRYPSASTRRKLMQGLGVEFDELFEIELPESVNSPPEAGRRGTAAVTFYFEEGRPMTGSWIQDLWTAFRCFGRVPGFSLAVTLVLALAIGANGALFSVIDGVILRPLPFRDPDRLYLLYQTDRHRGTQREGFSVPDLLDLRERNPTFTATSGIRFGNMTWIGEGEPRRLPTEFVTENHFQVLGVDPLLGRVFAPGDSEPGNNRIVLISESIWKDRFGGTADALTRSMTLDGLPYQVVGVMPREASMSGSPGDEIWVPLYLDLEQWRRGMHVLTAFARLPEGVPAEKAEQELAAVMAQLETEFPEDNGARGARLANLQGEIVRGVADGLWLLLMVVACVLLIASVNVANLFLSRLNDRRSEFALRSALGAGRRLLARQVFSEGLVLVLAGCAAGLGVAWLGVRWLVYLAPADLPRLEEVALNGRVVLYSIAAGLLSWLVVSAIPALRFSRADLLEMLKEDGRSSAGHTRQQHWLRNSFVVAQVGLAIMLVIGAGLLLRSFWERAGIDPGLNTERVLSLNMELAGSRYRFPENWPFLKWPAITQLQEGVLESLRAIPEVESAAFSISNPLASGWTTRTPIVGRPEAAADQQEESYFLPVSEDYFSTLGIPLLRGRSLQRQDDDSHPLVALVNESFLATYFPDGQDPLGERVMVYGAPREIVGVVGDVRFRGLTRDSDSAVYLPARQNPLNSLTLVVKTRKEPLALLPEIREAVWQHDSNVAFFAETSLEQFLRDARSQSRFTLSLLGLFAASALLLAIIGIYGVVSYLVSERTCEIGIRMALGASRGEVLRMVVGKGMLTVALGAGLGVLGALLAARLLDSLLYQVRPYDPLTFLAVPLALLGVGALACYLPARSASLLAPVAALRGEKARGAAAR